MIENDELLLSASSTLEKDKLLATVLLGMLRGVETSSISIQEAQVYLINPRVFEKVKSYTSSNELIEAFHKSLFIEDVIDIFPNQPERLKKTINEIEDLLFKVFVKPSLKSEKKRWMK